MEKTWLTDSRIMALLKQAAMGAEVPDSCQVRGMLGGVLTSLMVLMFR